MNIKDNTDILIKILFILACVSESNFHFNNTLSGQNSITVKLYRDNSIIITFGKDSKNSNIV